MVEVLHRVLDAVEGLHRVLDVVEGVHARRIVLLQLPLCAVLEQDVRVGLGARGSFNSLKRAPAPSRGTLLIKMKNKRRTLK